MNVPMSYASPAFYGLFEKGFMLYLIPKVIGSRFHAAQAPALREGSRFKRVRALQPGTVNVEPLNPSNIKVSYDSFYLFTGSSRTYKDSVGYLFEFKKLSVFG